MTKVEEFSRVCNFLAFADLTNARCPNLAVVGCGKGDMVVIARVPLIE